MYKHSRPKIQGYAVNGTYKDGEEPTNDKMGTSFIFKLPDGQGALANALACLDSIDLVHIESKPDVTGKYEFYAETMTKADDEQFKDAIAKLTDITQVRALTFKTVRNYILSTRYAF